MNIVLWILQILLALLFLFAGVSKFLIPYEEMVKNLPVALPHWFILFIGVCETLGGLGLILPWLLKIRPGLTPLAAWLLTIIMLGAVVISAMGSIPSAIFPLVIGILLVIIGYGRSGTKAMP